MAAWWLLLFLGRALSPPELAWRQRSKGRQYQFKWWQCRAAP
jgi:hypothetical protein